MKPAMVGRWLIAVIFAAAASANDASMVMADSSYVVRLHGSEAEALRQVNTKSPFDDAPPVSTLPGEPMPMTASNGKRYVCYVPTVSSEEHDPATDVKQTRVEIGREIAEKVRPKCLTHADVKSRTLFEVCHSKAIHRADLLDGTQHADPASRAKVADYTSDADLKPLVEYMRIKPSPKSPEAQFTPETLLYTQYFGPNIAVQFACSDAPALAFLGLHTPTPSSPLTAFLLGSRSFCLDKYAESALDLSVDHFLKPLTTANTCIKRTEGWWTYEVCFGNKISQFRRETTGEITAEFSLGQWSAAANDALQANHKAILSEFMDGTHDKEQPAYEEIYDSGTPCDAVDRSRMTRLLLFCPTLKTQPPYIISIQETSTCNYMIKVAAPAVCAHPHFAKEDRRRAELAQAIHCVPDVDDVEEDATDDAPPTAPVPNAKSPTTAKDEL
ncbi:hypothetical protein SPRG_02566 [Saprolegnia parasitica CBS 223.65]|uniref:MRH domain-containing protein n=1 Tax=Saprolegnia parasitica (strain CBS 223.65) TaxID=695850 RepID=A0A067CQ96_SAPPC|nr:hypothetical protein SPRG_02566 [Saprolegnia parasitica CBS 223.65]KDO32874.1 hypothetical protein SPRG_02566 [Saprolegnia parasitica CBS 223.65]|eukprot:XP_012196525.1 hypothetical protein SPRG_02566 [Saprolegnia parasitica CBS 223.65]